MHEMNYFLKYIDRLILTLIFSFLIQIALLLVILSTHVLHVSIIVDNHVMTLKLHHDLTELRYLQKQMCFLSIT